MSLTVLRGPAGSGKSTYLIELVNSSADHEQVVRTFASQDDPNPATTRYGVMGSRRAGLTCPIDHFVTTREACRVLDKLQAGTLAVFDEAYRYAPEIAASWGRASARGVEIVVSTPSDAQLRELDGHDLTEKHFSIECQHCAASQAVTALVDVNRNETLAVCQGCEKELMDSARAEILRRLQDQTPYPGEMAIYQPVELPECSEWRLLRPDSGNRFDLMAGLVQEKDVSLGSSSRPTYLDIGCNTGYFCQRMSELGFAAHGVDVVFDDIDVARLLDVFVRRSGIRYTVADAHAYLTETGDEMIDVTSAFAVFQWVMMQTSVARGVECLELLFAKTRMLCFLEMGYGCEEQYDGKLPREIDRSWVFNIMSSKGNFAEIRMYDARQHGLMFGSRDLFVGVK